MLKQKITSLPNSRLIISNYFSYNFIKNSQFSNKSYNFSYKAQISTDELNLHELSNFNCSVRVCTESFQGYLLIESASAWLTPWGGVINDVANTVFPYAGLIEEDLLLLFERGQAPKFTEWRLQLFDKNVRFDQGVEIWLEFSFNAEQPRRETRLWLGCKVEQLRSLRQSIPCLQQTRISSFVATLPVPWCLELGVSQIQYGDLVRIEAGDLLRVDSWHVRDEALAGCLYTLCVDGARLACWCKMDGTSAIVDSSLEMESQQPHHALQVGNTEANDRFDSLNQLEIRLSFELDEKVVALGDIKDIAPGYIFELGQPVESCQIKIRANGQLIGRGQLVSVGELLAVRVSEFVSAAKSLAPDSSI